MFKIPNNDNEPMRYLTYEQMNLINAFRNINQNYATYERFTLDCTLLNAPCFEAAYSRLLGVPYDAFRIFENYYSEENAAALYNLMVQDAILMHNLTNALIARNEEAADSVMQQWTQNIDAISELYARLNPYWTREQWNNLLIRNMQLNYQQILTLLSGDCARAFDIYDRIRSQAILIGDYQARGIMRALESIQENIPVEDLVTV